MNHEEVNIEAPEEVTYEDLKKAANRTANWRERLAAVEELGQKQWNNEQTIGLLSKIMANDTVYQVQEAAYRNLKRFGQNVKSPVRRQGELVKGVNKVLVRVKKSLPEGHTFEEFKEKLKKMRIDIYDTYEGDKGAEFDQWLESIWASLSRR
ncbi:HEAT repeat domain-containing protein [Paenibacillus segetis]|uniref:Esterase n=1 Tax=Paenibacillus segetis TaxID=1325360 RepID=A0ABQ1Y4Z9_9BACL|nr:HEAT repeat domain-containing protein [Paenibacillus segetis]GGH11867.1 hypothetical protein GCM10008013_03940 [Paenibacillus segetis]